VLLLHILKLGASRRVSTYGLLLDLVLMTSVARRDGVGIVYSQGLVRRAQLTLYDADSGLAPVVSHASRPSLANAITAAATTSTLHTAISPFALPHTPHTRCYSACSFPAMHLSTLLLAAVSAVAVSATPSWVPGQVAIQEDFKVPGDNPLYFCSDPKDNIVEIKKVDLNPNPPQPYVATCEDWL
jgi:hypothetical protein